MRIEWVIALVIGSAFMGSSLITPLYASYQKAFGFSEITLTLIYAAYVLGNLGALLFLGKLSDRIGRRPVALTAVAVGCCSMLLFLFAHGTLWLVLARILSGVSVGIATGTGAAWLSDISEDKHHATIVTNAANAFGFALGPLLAGPLVQWSPRPLQFPFYVFLPILVIAGVLVAQAQESVKDPKPITADLVRPRLGVPAEIRAQFIALAVAAFGIFAIVGFYAGLIPTTLARDLHRPSPVLAAAIVCELACLAGVFTFALGWVESGPLCSARYCCSCRPRRSSSWPNRSTRCYFSLWRP
jgi:MFS family permease